MLIFALAIKSIFSLSNNLPKEEEPKLRSKGILPVPVINPSFVIAFACFTLKTFPSYSPVLVKVPKSIRSNVAFKIFTS